MRLSFRMMASAALIASVSGHAIAAESVEVLLKQGVLKQFGGPEDMYHRPANVFVTNFMGSPDLLPAPGSPVRVGVKARLAADLLRAILPDAETGVAL
ncbi:hypothetical protein [Rhizobium sp. BK251]|uniref:hypothetical protein n=1 Tax=Rhizobium sp. BK251 TaxID=2512125 RepID=UPI001048CBFB|nr:hypothetical protein [Rhizobium sp. BK251]TCL64092.1 hypothetical protein EV286_11527 [Rhizobium sp. BK251]